MPQRYLISDNNHNPIAPATLLNTPRSNPLVLAVEAELFDQVLALKEVCLIGVDDENAFAGRLLGRSLTGSCRIEVEPLERLGREARQSLRVPIRFQSLMYPISGAWRGQHTFISQDLSCGGLAMISPVELAVGEELELVLPVTDEPLLVHAKVLRPLPAPADAPEEGPVYALKFNNLTNDEEAVISKAVYSIQLARR